MIDAPPFAFALGAAVALAALEVITGTFVLLGFCIGCLAVAAAEALTGGFSLGRDTLLFAAIGLISIVVLRRAFGRPGDTKISRGDVNDY